jgi:hypothetical protein
MNNRILLMILGIVLTIFGIQSPMLLIIPMWIFTYLFKDKLTQLFNKIPSNYRFIIAGILFGLLTEIFAIFENISKPAEEQFMLSTVPMLDLIYGFVYYLFVILAWYIIVRKINFSKKEIFFITGFYGVLVEQTGGVFLGIFTIPGIGLLYAFIVMFVYGLFPMLAYMITKKSFDQQRKPSNIWHYLLAAFMLFIQWAIYGNFILPLLIRLFT